MVQWKIDPSHSQIEFAVRHLAISTVRGRFRKFDVTVAVDEDGTPRAIDVVIDANSIDTAEPQRDNHLRSADFLEVTTYPHITFRSTQIDRLGLHRYRVAGDVTIREASGDETSTGSDHGRFSLIAVKITCVRPADA